METHPPIAVSGCDNFYSYVFLKHTEPNLYPGLDDLRNKNKSLIRGYSDFNFNFFVGYK